MSYKSKHTGAQVDEAVSKVLNGEVGGGADWNAAKGEAGYIENRTHCSKTIFSKFIEPYSELSEYNTEIKDADENRFHDINYIEILVNDNALEVFPVHFNYNKTNIISKYIEEETITITVSCVEIYDERSIKVEFSNRPLNYDLITIGILGLNVSFLSEKYIPDSIARKTDIPDTVIKTTPQTLSDTDKNQVKENLGITDAVTPDWNAQKGEAGYIENKPFYEHEQSYRLDDVDKIDRCDYIEEGAPAFGLIYDSAITVFKDEYLSDNTIDSFGAYETALSSRAEEQGCVVIEREDGRYELVIPWYWQEGLPGWRVVYSETTHTAPLPSRFLPDTVLKTTPQELSNDDKIQVKENLGISTPDWNAQEGEAGYIENKPFEFIDKHENAFYYNADHNPNYIIWDAHSAYDSSVIQILDFDGNPKYIDLTNRANGSFEEGMGNIFGDSFLSYEWIDGELGIEIPQWILDSDENIQTWVKILRRYSTGGELVKIDGTYLPNTIIKTTPQTLSNTDKNQALTNLGIDPVVLKYIMNPFVLQTGRIVPDELIASDGVSFKYPYAGMYRWAKGYAYDKDNFKYGDSDPGELGSVHCPKVTIYGAGNEIPDEGLPTSSSDVDYGRLYGPDSDNWANWFTTGVWSINKDTKQCYLGV